MISKREENLLSVQTRVKSYDGCFALLQQIISQILKSPYYVIQFGSDPLKRHREAIKVIERRIEFVKHNDAVRIWCDIAGYDLNKTRSGMIKKISEYKYKI